MSLLIISSIIFLLFTSPRLDFTKVVQVFKPDTDTTKIKSAAFMAVKPNDADGFCKPLDMVGR